MDWRAYITPIPSLATLPRSQVCENSLEGWCREGSRCHRGTHAITLIEDSTPTPPAMPSGNRFCPELRKPIFHHQPQFEDSGPGSTSPMGPRHDNDYVHIKDIKLLPTTDEILNTRRPYMPRKDHAYPHHLEGPSRLCDVHFRHLRQENVEPIIDACYHALQILVEPTSCSTWLVSGTTFTTPRGVAYQLFTNAAFEGAMFTFRDGAAVVISYDCPPKLRGRTIHNSTVFEEGLLCALIAVHEDTKELNVLFCEILMRHGTEAKQSKTLPDTRAALRLCIADSDDTEKVTQLLDYASSPNPNVTFALLDIPNVLPAGFMDHLRRLQALISTHESAFIDQIASMGTPFPIPFPRDLHSPTNGWNLQCIKSDSHCGDHFRIPAIDVDDQSTHERIINDLKSNTILDDGQADALFDSLARPFSLCQGPPGAGKSFFGVVWCRIALDSRANDHKKPVVVVCQTNHALDDFLGSLVQQGVKNVVRLGSQSSEEWTNQYMLKNLRHKTKLSRGQTHERSQAGAHVENIAKQASHLAESLSEQTIAWAFVEDFLKEHRPCIYNHFTNLQKVDVNFEDLRRSRNWTGFAFSYWIEGNDLQDTQRFLERINSLLGECDLEDDTEGKLEAFKSKILAAAQQNARRASSEVDGDGDLLWYLTLERRQTLAQDWLKRIPQRTLAEKLGELHRRYNLAKKRFKVISDKKDASILASQEIDIIAVTSTGCARNWELLRSIAPHSMIFEEASELLEVHSLVALVPSVKHVISIGDPLQLRPHVTQMALSTEQSILYGLDMSLFERAITQQTPLPYTQLRTQRRAHPDMADLLRVGAYPYLIDHESTHNSPEVRGFPKRMYWIRHHKFEDERDPRSPFVSSYSNKYEVDWVEAIVKYLIQTQGYTAGKITVITPYNGQLAALHARLARSYDLVLAQADKEDLIQKKLLIEDDAIVSNTDVTSVELGNMITVATVDNYQGEENDIIIFSPVRSNTNGKLGFLKIENRVNVAVSRARQGFIVVGNSDLIRAGSKQWASIINVFERKNAIGWKFPVFPCSKHFDVTIEISKPSEFDDIPPCTRPCGDRLLCGHECKSACHPVEMHTDGRKPCTGTHSYLPPCGHRIEAICGQAPGLCLHVEDEITLACGHKFTRLCSTATEEIKCKHIDRSITLDCGHTLDILCEDRTKPVQLECNQPCGVELRCGHLCTGECSICSIDKIHPPCIQKCQIQLSCGHKCDSVCHEGSCPSCRQTCSRACKHKDCHHRCGEPCHPCTERLEPFVCPHRAEAERFCCLPNMSLPCSKPCKRLLMCNKHICPGLCGEKCPSECPECVTNNPVEPPTITLDCDHSFPVADIDGRFRISEFYQLKNNNQIVQGRLLESFESKHMVCPRCGAASPNTPRYELGYSIPELGSTVDRLYLTFGSTLLRFQYIIIQTQRATDIDEIVGALRAGPLAARHNEYLVRGTTSGLASVQQEAISYRDNVVIPIQKSIHGITTMLDNADLFPIPVQHYKLRFDLEIFQCRSLIVTNGMRMLKGLKSVHASGDRANRVLAEGLEFAITRQISGDVKTLEELVFEAKEANLSRLEAEFLITQINLALVMRYLGQTSDVDVQSKLQRISDLMTASPNSAGKLSDLVKSLKNCEAKGSVLESFGHENSRATVMWHRYGRHRLGTLTHCKNGHPYSSETFIEGCGECS